MKLAILALAAALMSGEMPTLLKPATQEIIAPVHLAYLKVEAEQAALPPPVSDSERLERLFDLDQAGRVAEEKIDISISRLDNIQRMVAMDKVWSEIQDHDLADQKALKAMMPAKGWFSGEAYSKKASLAAFLIVQHAGKDPELMRQTLAKLEPLAKTSAVYGGQYALMYDRVALEFDHKPQRFGSQVECRQGAWRPRDLEDPEHVDQRRKAVGLSETEAEYLKHFGDLACN